MPHHWQQIIRSHHTKKHNSQFGSTAAYDIIRKTACLTLPFFTTVDSSETRRSDARFARRFRGGRRRGGFSRSRQGQRQGRAAAAGAGAAHARVDRAGGERARHGGGVSAKKTEKSWLFVYQ